VSPESLNYDGCVVRQSSRNSCGLGLVLCAIGFASVFIHQDRFRRPGQQQVLLDLRTYFQNLAEPTSRVVGCIFSALSVYKIKSQRAKHAMSRRWFGLACTNRKLVNMGDNYTVLARRFRPQTFDDVVGQERVAQTLRNAMRDGRVAHAYLFTGARGVGKTSMARIFAKALNCPHVVDGIPCNECEICQGISTGHDVDVSEIDGASNRGIDDVRSLRANVNVKSMRSKYKVYIIDEVHMLTKEAFNALLKTLEEPPPLVKFVFCTTEPNKLPDTILSRCQRFDFGTIATNKIAKRLSELAKAEGVEVAPEAIGLVARRAAGSMRDSQSLFDQLLAFGNKQIGPEDVHRLLGTAPDTRLIELIGALIDRRRSDALRLLHQALTDGVQLDALTDQLLGYLRDLMITACGAEDVPLLSVGEENQPTLRLQASQFGLQTTSAAMQILAEAKGRMQRVTHGRVLLELALVRISLLQDLDRLDDLIEAWKSGGGISAVSSPPRVQPPAARRVLPVADVAATPVETAPSSPLPAVPDSRLIHSAALPEPAEAGIPQVAAGDATSSEVASEDGVDVVAPNPSNALPSIELRAGNEGPLKAALVAQSTGLLAAHLRCVDLKIPPGTLNSANSGPNHLEILIPERYDMAKVALSKPQAVSEIEAKLHELTGQPIRVRLGTSNVPAPDAEAAHRRPMSKPQQKSIETDRVGDSLVQAVGQALGVTSWRVLQLEKLASIDEQPPTGCDEAEVAESDDPLAE
jgi:DNA polymerase III subunit gamma/tau